MRSFKSSAVVRILLLFLSVYVRVYALGFGEDPSEDESAHLVKHMNRRTLRVVGQAERLLSPDVCYIKFTRETVDPKSVAVAYKTNALAMAAISSAVKLLGIDAKDMQTTNLQLNPQYRYEQSTMKQIKDGYRVSQELSVKVRDLTKVSSIVDAGVGAGATEIGSVTFTVENPTKSSEEIQIEALLNAKAKALRICDATGMKLAKPITIVESDARINEAAYFGGQARGAVNMAKSMSADVGGGGSDLQVEPGEIKLQTSVTIIYEIE